ncbi:hypothetical protein GNI_125540 [Gregarina niphandrodes]|uniref:Uncharacterized protein n=1 Tax=Gregarina niphandrodes TaxID=110365 RepID=A0A023B2L5_GRENI|nr:hypothetical protein GNI_125540 [Gregarina niphandrodes]EZG50616.1 hypothetical protein GNI_125540 [Gregarina niphandrodes]|eukprot:XP_011132001.1 hypothetical protein GNI_125540 [Gregarina niphandrodes]
MSRTAASVALAYRHTRPLVLVPGVGCHLSHHGRDHYLVNDDNCVVADRRHNKGLKLNYSYTTLDLSLDSSLDRCGNERPSLQVDPFNKGLILSNPDGLLSRYSLTLEEHCNAPIRDGKEGSKEDQGREQGREKGRENVITEEKDGLRAKLGGFQNSAKRRAKSVLGSTLERVSPLGNKVSKAVRKPKAFVGEELGEHAGECVGDRVSDVASSILSRVKKSSVPGKVASAVASNYVGEKAEDAADDGVSTVVTSTVEAASSVVTSVLGCRTDRNNFDETRGRSGQPRITYKLMKAFLTWDSLHVIGRKDQGFKRPDAEAHFVFGDRKPRAVLGFMFTQGAEEEEELPFINWLFGEDRFVSQVERQMTNSTVASTEDELTPRKKRTLRGTSNDESEREISNEDRERDRGRDRGRGYRGRQGEKSEKRQQSRGLLFKERSISKKLSRQLSGEQRTRVWRNLESWTVPFEQDNLFSLLDPKWTFVHYRSPLYAGVQVPLIDWYVADVRVSPEQLRLLVKPSTSGRAPDINASVPMGIAHVNCYVPAKCN